MKVDGAQDDDDDDDNDTGAGLDTAKVAAPRTIIAYPKSKRAKNKEFHKDEIYFVSTAKADTGADECCVLNDIIMDCSPEWRARHHLCYVKISGVTENTSNQAMLKTSKKNDSTVRTFLDTKKNEHVYPAYDMSFWLADNTGSIITINIYPVVAVKDNLLGGALLKHLMQIFENGDDFGVMHSISTRNSKQIWVAEGKLMKSKKAYTTGKRRWKELQQLQMKAVSVGQYFATDDKEVIRESKLAKNDLYRKFEEEKAKDKDKNEDRSIDMDYGDDLMSYTDSLPPNLQVQLEFHGNEPHLKHLAEKYKDLLFKPTNEEIDELLYGSKNSKDAKNSEQE